MIQSEMRSSLVGITLFSILLAACGITASVGSHAGELGVNKVDLARQYIPSAASGSEAVSASLYIHRLMAKKAIADAHDAGMSFMRVGVTGYWPNNFGDRENDLAVWQADPQRFWEGMDEMFTDLDAAGIRLIPSFLWNPVQFPVLGSDTLDTFLRDPQSPSRELMMQFVKEFVQRYRNRKTILFYELGNELSLFADLHLAKNCPKIITKRCVWTDFATADLIDFSRAVVSSIKSLDPSHPISSGYSLPRVAAFHLERQPAFSSRGPDWTPDSPQEFQRYLLDIHEPFDIISIHIYRNKDDDRFGYPPNHQYQLIANAIAAAKAAHKKLFVGEFGDTELPFVGSTLHELVKDQVDYAAIWVWEYYQFNTYETLNTPASRFSVEPGYSDDLILLLTETQRALGGKVSDLRLSSSPRVILTWPLPCATIQAPVNLAAVASDHAKKVKDAEFLVDGKSLAKLSEPPYYARLDPVELQGRPTADIEVRATASSGVSASFSSTVRLRANGECSIAAH
jgi:Bacterial Ig domain